VLFVLFDPRLQRRLPSVTAGLAKRLEMVLSAELLDPRYSALGSEPMRRWNY